VDLCPQLGRLAVDHPRWLARIERRSGEDEARYAARILALWEEEVLPRCRVEEEVLLPELTRQLSASDAVVVFAMGDHLVLRQLVREARAAEGPAQSQALEALASRLAEHLRFEDRILFPQLQATLGCLRLSALAGEMGRAADPSQGAGHSGLERRRSPRRPTVTMGASPGKGKEGSTPHGSSR
jgi:hypothetical protein